MKIKTGLLILIAFMCVSALWATGLNTASVFTDNMVLQRNMPIPVWGRASPSEKVTVEFAGQKKETVAGKNGKWMIKLDPIKADSIPEAMKITSGSQTKNLKNILVGDVWLCSGQSNMVMTLNSCKNSQKEAADANDPLLRYLRVMNTPDASKRLDTFTGKWVVCSPEVAKSFSGVAYFFGRKLRKDLKIPIGLINSSVGGTPAESWMSKEVLESDEMFKPILDRYTGALKVYPEKKKEYEAKIKPWLEIRKKSYQKTDAGDPGVKKLADGWADRDFDDKSWEKLPGPLPKMWTGPSVVWLRASFDIPEKWAGKTLYVTGLYVKMRIFGSDSLYFNKEKIAENKDTGMHSIEYKISGKDVKAGKAVIAIRIFTDKKAGGFYGILKVGPKGVTPLVLRNKTKFKAAWTEGKKPLEILTPPGAKPMGPDHSNSPFCLFNAFINPLIPFPFRGAIWYQGESNAPRAWQYRKLLPAMIKCWRDEWKTGDFPFLIVQLANFKRPSPSPVESTWAELREAQAVTAEEVPQAGIVTAIDIGDAVDVHPTNKQEVGRRLALAAENISYGKDIVYAGPEFAGIKIDGSKVTITFKNIGKGLTVKGGEPLKGFAIAGKDKKFVWADAELKNDEVAVSSPKVKNPVAVRYAWADNPDKANLFNKDGFPAFPFRTDNWKGITFGKK